MAKLIYHMPTYYKNANVVKDMTKPIDDENISIENLIAEYVNQFIVNTATFALGRYEEQYGLPINPSGLSYAERRSRIKAKMRTYGVVTKETLQNIVNSWTNADIEIIEDYANYKVVIKFVSIVGVPENMEDVYSAIREVLPAHLNVEYQFKYNKWSDVESKTWGQLEQYTWQEVLEKGVI